MTLRIAIVAPTVLTALLSARGAALAAPAKATRPAQTRPARQPDALADKLAALARKRLRLAESCGDASAVARALQLLRRLDCATREESLEMITARLALGEVDAARKLIKAYEGETLSPFQARLLEGACADHAGQSDLRDSLWQGCLAKAGKSEFQLYRAAQMLDSVGCSAAGVRRFNQAIIDCAPDGTRYDLSAALRLTFFARNHEDYKQLESVLKRMEAMPRLNGMSRTLRSDLRAAVIERLRRALDGGDSAALVGLARENPDDDIALAVGRWLRLNGRDAEAEKFVATAAGRLRARIRADETDPSPLNALAWLYARTLTELKEAERLARKAVELEPETGAYLDTLGEALFALGRVDEALTVELRAVFADRGDSRVFFFEQLKRFREARK